MLTKSNSCLIPGKTQPDSIAIVRALPGLGDLLCLVPALRSLRAAFPLAEITLIGLPWAQQFVQRFHQYVDGWLEFSGWPGIPEVPIAAEHVVASLYALQQRQFDLVLQMHGSGSYINSFAVLAGRTAAGFFPSGQFCPDRDRFLPYPEQEPEILRHLRLLEFLSIPAQGTHLEFPIEAADWQALEAVLASNCLTSGRYVCIHPGASVSERRWSHQGFAAVADRLAAEGWQIVLTGTSNEAELTRSVAEAMRYPAVNLAGKTNLGAIAALLKTSRLLICNDTGVSHLATAVGTPSVVIFSDSDPLRWGPLDRQRHRVVCRWAFAEGCESDRVAESVLTAAQDLLRQEYAYAH